MLMITRIVFILMLMITMQDGAYEVDHEFDGKGLTPYDPAHNSTYLLSGQYQ